MRSISILGCGWLGKPLATSLIKSGFKVSGSTTQEAKLSELQLEGITSYVIKFSPHIEGDNYTAFFKSEVLIVCIAPQVKAGQADNFLVLLKDAMTHVLAGNIEKVLFVSSTSVYANKNKAMTEDEAQPEHYMVKAENLFAEQTKFKTTVLRFAGLVGPGRHPGKFLAGKKEIAGGNNPVNLIHLEDCIKIIKTIIDRNVWGEIFNACAPHHPTREFFYVQASKLLALPIPSFVDSIESNYKIIDSEKLQRFLNYEFKYNDPLKFRYD